jgi:hypothetical protein
MNSQVVAIIFQQGGLILSKMLEARLLQIPSHSKNAKQPPITVDYEFRTDDSGIITENDGQSRVMPTSDAEKATAIATGCVPCAIGHVGTVSGLLNEAVRFAKSGGLLEEHVIGNINISLDELNAMERVDMRPEKIVHLPPWEKELADRVLITSRKTRHGLEDLKTVDQLEKLAADVQAERNNIGIAWYKNKLSAGGDKDGKGQN